MNFILEMLFGLVCCALGVVAGIGIGARSRSRTPVTQVDLEKLEKIVMAKLSELAGQIGAIKDQVTKSKDEVVKRIAELEKALSDVEIPAEATAALDALKGEVQKIDDINVDAPQ
jgi:hypothetical protein